MHGFKLRHSKLYDSVRIQDGLVHVSLRLELRQSKGCLARISDLAAVPTRVAMVVEVFGGEASNSHLVDIDPSTLQDKTLLDHLHVNLEHSYCLILVECWVVEADVDPGGEGLVKVADAVGC